MISFFNKQWPWSMIDFFRLGYDKNERNNKDTKIVGIQKPIKSLPRLNSLQVPLRG